MRQETRFKFNAYLTQLAKLNGISVDDVSKKFTVEPSVTQTLMNTVQASSAFLQMINILPVAEMKGEKIGVGVTGTIASTTDTIATTTSGPMRRSRVSPWTAPDCPAPPAPCCARTAPLPGVRRRAPSAAPPR